MSLGQSLQTVISIAPVMEKTRTHDVSLEGYHLPSLQAFGETLTKAAAVAFPLDGRSRYTDVRVLLLSWVDDSLGVTRELNELEEVFRLKYKYMTETWQIPSVRAHTSLGKRITKFVDDYESRESLLIVYYGGHGGMNDDRQCVWSCENNANSPTVQWYGLQTVLEEAESDILILLDCCAAASSAAGNGNGVTEVVAACGFETWTPGVCEHSFTRSLIEELKYWSQGPPLSVALLHNKILSRMKYWKPRYGLLNCGMTGHLEFRKTPVYIVLGNERKQRSIEIAPFKPKTSSMSGNSSKASTEMPAELATGVAPLIGNEVVLGKGLECDPSSMAKVWPDTNFECPKVLIALSLEKEQWLSTEAWTEWLGRVPGLVKYAHVEGVYESHSNLVLCSIPVAIWDIIPADPAVNFVGFVRSGNLLSPECNPDSGAKATKTATSSDVLPFSRRRNFDSKARKYNQIDQSVTAPSRLSKSSLEIYPKWSCGWCLNGPMYIKLDAHCTSCNRPRDVHATLV